MIKFILIYGLLIHFISLILNMIDDDKTTKTVGIIVYLPLIILASLYLYTGGQ